jgi:hypothetical protein
MNRYLLLSAAIVLLAGCRKYDEGPAFSIRSKKERLANLWEIEKYFVNGEDKTATVDTMFLTFEFRKNGEYQEQMAHHYMYYIDNGSWKFTEDKKNVDIYRSNDTMRWHITKLEEDRLWVVYTPISFFRFEYHLKTVE